MYIGGMFQRSANKLGPLLCRDTYEQLDLPHLGAAATFGCCCHIWVKPLKFNEQFQGHLV